MEYKFRRWLRQFLPLIGKICLLVLMALLTLGSLYAGFDPDDGLIAENVTIGGIDVGGMTMERAYRELKYTSEEVLERSTLWVDLPESRVPLEPKNTKASLNCHRAVLDAWLVGRIGNRSHDLPLAPYLKLNEGYIRDVLADYAARYDTKLTPWSHAVLGEMPDLEMENRENKQAQILQLSMGIPTTKLDQEDSFRQIMAVYNSAFAAAQSVGYQVSGPFRVDILEKPELPDLQAIYDDLYIAPVDDSLDLENHQVIPGAFGYHFDLEAAQKQVAEADFGEKLSIPMEFLEPEISGEKVYFRDVLGYCETPHTKDENRNNNLRRACESMNGLVLQPGDTFSYNDTLGPRTKENGYLRAGAYSGWILVQSYGGGICQGSSTIYGAVLQADLEIVQRKNHGYAVSYVPYGLDATVNWGGPDFQFRNNTHFPIQIAAEVSDGFVKVSILGTEERDYYVEMESEYTIGSSTIHAQSYKCKYDRETKELISREKEASSNYMR